MNLEILKHNIQRYENHSYYYLRVALVYLCIIAALAVKFEMLGAMIIVVLTGLVLILGYPGGEYTWREDSDIKVLASCVERLRIRRLRRIRRILILGSIVALGIDQGVECVLLLWGRSDVSMWLGAVKYGANLHCVKSISTNCI